MELKPCPFCGMNGKVSYITGMLKVWLGFLARAVRP